MKINFNNLPRTTIQVDTLANMGPFEGWRHCVGQGGVNSLPMPEKVTLGLNKLQPRLVRVFLQEYFDIYPDHGVFQWDKLDTYLGSFAGTGTKVLATINLKPPVLFPEKNHKIWRPNNINEWQTLLYKLAQRYSVDKPIITHWEHVNEPDIGEWGGCPYYITSPDELHEFYVINTQPILSAFPAARVGGPCTANFEAVVPFVDRCIQHKTQLDFVSYHRYDDDPQRHTNIANLLFEKTLHAPTAYGRTELMINEWNKGFEPPWSGSAYDSVSLEEMSMQSRRAAHVAKIILNLMQTPLTWSFYYLLWDNCMFHHEFSSFFSPDGAREIMYKHWNEAPHRFGLFSESGKVRPQYFVYQMLSRMHGNKVQCMSTTPDLTITAVHNQKQTSILVVNFDLQASRDQAVKVQLNGLQPGLKYLTTYRIDGDCRWSEEQLELIPIEQRRVDVLPEFECQFFSPADSVLWIKLEDINMEK